MPQRQNHGGNHFVPNAHGGRNANGFMGRARAVHNRLNTPLHPSLDGKGIDVDIPDFVDRCENGNGFK
ncbi:unnamed protein product, partial [Adineta ricciae]